MRHIRKSAREPAAFYRWKARARGTNWHQTFEQLRSKVKHILKAALIREQLGICCYCESKIQWDNSHIEHFRPQETYPELELDYNNLFCCCQSNLQHGAPRHCGSSKSNWFDPDLMISPLDPDCASHFLYTGDGHIQPRIPGDAAAKATIAHLALDIPKLVESRRRVLEIFLDDTLTDEEFLSFTNKYFKHLSPENPPEYISAVTDVLKI